MSATVQPESKSSSRRALLAGALGGIGAWAAGAIGRATPVEAAIGDPIRMGQLNDAGGTQTVVQTDCSGAVLMVKQASAASAVRGEATSGRGVVGIAGSGGTGLWGYSPDHNGVFALSDHGVCLNGRAVGSNSISVYADAQGTNSIAVLANGPSRFFGQTQVFAPFLLSEVATPAAPGPSQLTLFARDNGSGKTQLCVRFPTGAVQVIKTEP